MTHCEEYGHDWVVIETHTPQGDGPDDWVADEKHAYEIVRCSICGAQETRQR